MKDKKYDGFAIASFVLGLLAILVIYYDDGLWGFVIAPIISILSITTAIIGLKRISKKNLKGKALAMIGIIISGIILSLGIMIILTALAFGLSYL